MDQGSRERCQAKALRLVTCPTCGSPAGESCVGVRGHRAGQPTHGYLHRGRWIPLYEEFEQGRRDGLAECRSGH